jgi:hypothetical protein
MGTTLTGTTPQDTYDSLIKVTDNGPLSGTAKYLSDGLGNDSALAVSTAAVGIGTNTPSEVLQVSKTQSATTRLQITNAQTGGSTAVRASLRVTANDRIGEFVAVNGDSVYVGAASNHTTSLMSNGAGELHATPAGNVGIGTLTPAAKLTIEASNPTTGILTSLKNSASSAQSGALMTFTQDSLADWGIGQPAGANAFAFYSGTFSGNLGTEIARFQSTGGISFNGDTAAANALDDYEEGTWTPSLIFSGGSTGITYTTQAGKYVKIGSKVSVNCYVVLSNKGSSTGTARIDGLPFTVPNAAGNYSPATIVLDGAITYTGQAQGFANINSTSVALGNVTEAGTATALTDTNFSNSSAIMISLTYLVS